MTARPSNVERSIDWSKYDRAVRYAKVCLHRLRRQTIGGKDAHDFAMDSLRLMPWHSSRVRYDILDAFRKETRHQIRQRSRITFVQHVSPKNDWIESYSFLTDRQQEIALLLSVGWSKTRIAQWFDRSQSTISNEVNQIRNQIIEHLLSESPMKRNYKAEYAKFQSSTAAKKDRASRNKVRRAAEREGRVSKGDGNDIDHKNGNPRDNRKSNLRVVHRSSNRARK